MVLFELLFQNKFLKKMDGEQELEFQIL